MKVFVLLYWFYEGDSNLADSFIDVFSTYEKALKFKNLTDDHKLKILSSMEVHNLRSGKYGDPSFYEIRECIIK